ncbi:MAG: co-chaperone GroES [Deltaproteobacteria bacterium]
MNLRPLNDKIIVKRIDTPNVTKGGIVIPDSVKEKPQEGEVMAVGNGWILNGGKVLPLEIKKGDRILFGKFGGNEVKFDGEEYIILGENEVLAVLEP